MDLVRRHVQEEHPECQEVQRMTEKQKTRALLKQDKILRSNWPGTTRGYYLYMEDDQGCMVEQRDGTLVPDTEVEQVPPTDRIIQPNTGSANSCCKGTS